MPSLISEEMEEVTHLTRWALDRLDTISFFLVVFLITAIGVQKIVNGLSRSVHWLPHLSYFSSLAVVFLWSLTFVIVLTMISGARELMTPGAWRKDGYTYSLDRPSTTTTPTHSLSTRREQLLAIHVLLATYRAKSDDAYPTSLADITQLQTTGDFPRFSILRYEYRIPAANATKDELVVIESVGMHEGPRLAITTQGNVILVSDD